MSYQIIQLRRGLHASLPQGGNPGEPHFTTDRRNLYVAIDATTMAPVTPAIDQLQTLATVDLAADLLIIHDADATGQKEKKITVQALKDALNIPAGVSDERVAVAAGAPAGYLWGTDGTDGVLRGSTTISITRPSGQPYVILSVVRVDGGTW